MTSAFISLSFKNIAIGAAGLVLALCCFFAAAPQAHALSNCVAGTPQCSDLNLPQLTYPNGLTENQVSALLNLLSSFGADQATINNVGSILRDGKGSSCEARGTCLVASISSNPVYSSDGTFTVAGRASGTSRLVLFITPSSYQRADDAQTLANLNKGGGRSGYAMQDVYVSNGRWSASFGDRFGEGTFKVWVFDNSSCNYSTCYTGRLLTTGKVVISDKDLYFEAIPSSGSAPLTVEFVTSASGRDGDYFVDFDDNTGQAAMEKGLHYTYNSPGTYTPKLYKCTLHVSEKDCDGSELAASATVRVTGSSSTAPTCTVSASPSTIARNAGNTLGITWSSQNAVSRTYKGYTPAGNVYYSSPQIAVSGTLQDTSFNNLAPGTYTRVDTVVGANGATATCSAQLTVTAGSNTSATFSATPISGAAPLAVNFKGSVASAGTYSAEFGDGASQSITLTSGRCTGDTNVATCDLSIDTLRHTYTGAGTYTAILREPLDGRVVGSQTITVSSAAPSCTISDTPSTVGVGGRLLVEWSASNATSRTYTVRNPSGTVIYTSPAIPTSGRLDNTYFDNLLSTPGTYTRTDTVTGPGGTATCQAQLLVTASAAPTCSVAYSPSTIARNAGQTLGITWSATNATSRSYVGINSLGNIFTGPHTISPSGSLQDTSFNNLAPGTYTRVDTVAGPGGNGNCYQTLTVTGPAAYNGQSSYMAAAAAVPLSMSADSLNLVADQINEVNYAIAGVLSSYVALFSPDTPQAAAAATAPTASPIAGESLALTLSYMPQSLYETVGKTTDFLAAVEMAPVYVITDALSGALFKAGIY